MGKCCCNGSHTRACFEFLHFKSASGLLAYKRCSFKHCRAVFYFSVNTKSITDDKEPEDEFGIELLILKKNVQNGLIEHLKPVVRPLQECPVSISEPLHHFLALDLDPKFKNSFRSLISVLGSKKAKRKKSISAIQFGSFPTWLQFTINS
jgi:hypothetical protein